MSFNGINVICGRLSNVDEHVSLVTDPAWSENMTAPGVTINAADAPPIAAGAPVAFMIQAFADGWIAIGKNPNATVGPRRAVRDGEDVVIAASAGDRVAWIEA